MFSTGFNSQGGLFGQPQQQQQSAPNPGSLFGQQQPAMGQTSLFGQSSQPQVGTTGSLFGQPSQPQVTTPGSLFGPSAQGSTPSLFGQSTQSAAPTSLFSQSQPSTGLFGGQSSNPSGAQQAPGLTTPNFGQSLFNNTPTQPDLPAPMGGINPQGMSQGSSLFGNPSGGLFGQQPNPSQPLTSSFGTFCPLLAQTRVKVRSLINYLEPNPKPSP